MRTDDSSIINECLNGESAAFGLLIDKYKEGIYAFVYDKLRNFQDAQDVTQEVFIQAYKGLHTLRRWESFTFWLYRIAYARCKLWIRTQSRRIDRDFIEDQRPETMENYSMSSHSDDRIREFVQETLELLPETYREVLTLYYFGGMNSIEIAKALGTSPTAIRHRLSRGRARLKEEMTFMMDTAFEGQGLPAGFTFRVVEAVKSIKINPMPKATALPWGLSAALGIMIAVLSFGSQVNIINQDIAMTASRSLPLETRALKSVEIPVEILNTSQISALFGNQGHEQDGNFQNKFLLAPQQDEGGSWTERASMPTARYAMSTAVVDGKIYVVGGMSKPGGIINTMEMFDPASNTWEVKAPSPRNNYGLAVATVNGKIYALGGTNGWKTSGAVDEYDPMANRWIRKTNLPTARKWPVAAVVDETIYVIGGVDKNLFATVEAYNPVLDEWSNKADLPVPGAKYSAAVVDGKIYVMGYRSDELKVHPEVYEYDPKFDAWTRKADMPTPRMALSMVAVDHYIYAIGGSSSLDPFNKVSTVEIYDTRTDVWKSGVELPNPRSHHVSAVVNGDIYAIGGVDSWLNHAAGDAPDSFVSDVESFNVSGSGNLSVSPLDKLNATWGEIKGESY